MKGQDKMNKVRTRFAPSPTGYMHIGNLRTALFAYLIAKQSGGDFILRIEDTDQGRYVQGATEVIYKTLKDVGLFWDEGPDIGGPVGPYIQSERMGMFKDYALQLVQKGEAYYCFCDKQRLDGLKSQLEAEGKTYRYDRHCRDLSQQEVREKLKAGTPYVIRQKMPTQGQVTFHDELYGDITVDCSELEDQILIKTDSMPTYNFANVVDDHLMGITHVVRGNEYLSSAPKYELLYKAFGWQAPKYIHVEHIMRDKHHKLSKRDGDASFQDLIDKGYLKQAVLNYIALLGWAPKGENEIYSLDELVKEFDIHGLSKAPAIFDPLKMKAINAKYIKALPPEKFAEYAIPYIKQAVHRQDVDAQYIASLLQSRTEVFTDIAQMVDFIDALPQYDNELYCHKKMKTDLENSLESLKQSLDVLSSLDDWTLDGLHDALFGLIQRLGVKNGIILWPLRVALSGKMSTPGGGVEIAYIIGKQDTLARIEQGIKQLSVK